MTIYSRPCFGPQVDENMVKRLTKMDLRKVTGSAHTDIHRGLGFEHKLSTVLSTGRVYKHLESIDFLQYLSLTGCTGRT